MFTDRRAFIILAGSVLLGQLSFFLTAAALPLFLSHVGASTARIGLEIGVGSIAGLVVTLIVGPAISRHPPGWFIAAGGLGSIAAAAFMLIFPYEPTIIVGRIVQGASYCVIGPAALTAVPRLAKARVGSVMGVMSTITSVPLAVGPAVGLALYDHGGAAWLLVPTMAIATLAVLAVFGLRVEGQPAGGTESSESEPNETDASANDTLAAPAPGTTLRFDGIAASLRRAVGRFGFDAAWTFELTADGLNGVYFGAILAYLPLLCARIHGPNAGLFFTADAVGVIVLRIPSGMLADRTHPRVPMTLGLAITVVALLALIPRPTVLLLVLAGSGTGIGAGMFANGLLTDLANRSTPANRGTAMSLALLGASLGVFVGASIAGLLYGPFGFASVIVFGIVCEVVGLGLMTVLFVRHGAKSR